MAFKLKASSPLTIKIDEKLKFKEFDPVAASKKVKYDPSGISILGKPINTYKSDKAQLAKPIERVGKGLQLFRNSRSQRRIDAFTKAGGMSPGSVKATKEGRAGMAADTKARKDKTGMYDPKKTPPKKTPPKNTPPKNTPPNNNKSKKVSFKSVYGKRDMKIYKNLDEAEFTAESKRQIASKKAGKGYDAPKNQMAGSKARKKVEAVKPMKAAGVDVKRQTPKLAGDVRTKAQKIRAKGVAILADKKLSTRKKQKQARSTRKQYDAEMAKNKKKKPIVKVKKKPVVKAKKKIVEVVAK
jgi:hypothetical protein